MQTKPNSKALPKALPASTGSNARATRRPWNGIKIPTEKIAASLARAHGNVSDAARKLRVDVAHLRRRIAADKTLVAIRDEAREALVDEAESALWEMVKDPSHPGHATTVKFVLATLGRTRGYTQRHELVGPEDESAPPLKIQFHFPAKEPDEG